MATTGSGVGVPSSSALSNLAVQRVMTKYIEWIKQEFEPLVLATPDDALAQQVDNAIRYWNTHSAYKWITMVSVTGTDITLPKDFKTVVRVFPAVDNGYFLDGHPLWSLLGITVLDNVTNDFMIMTEAFKSYKAYLGTDFRWTFVKSENPDAAGGHLLVQNVPAGSDQLCVMGTKRILADEDIQQEYIIEWVLHYAKALIKMQEGNTLRKATLVGAPTDGQDLVNEGNEERKELQERLQKDGRWIAFSRRF